MNNTTISTLYLLVVTLCSSGLIADYSKRESFRTLYFGQWVERENQMDFLSFSVDRQPVLDESWGLTEVNFDVQNWRKFTYSPNADREAILAELFSQSGIFISPVLKDGRGSNIIIPSPHVSIVMPFNRDWPAVLDRALEAIGTVVSIETITSPLGTPSQTWDYFAEMLAPLPVIKSAHHFEGLPQIFPDFDYNAPQGNVAFTIESDFPSGWHIFDTIEQLATVEGINSAEPIFLLRGYNQGIVSPHPIGNFWHQNNRFGRWHNTTLVIGDISINYHLHHGWQQVIQPNHNDLRLYDVTSQSWWWTQIDADVYPWVYIAGSGWHYYDNTTTNPRMFFRPAASEWVSEDQL